MTQRFEKPDPHLDRETEKYGRPIPSREYIQSVLEGRKRPLSKEQLINMLNVTDPELQEACRRRLNAMVRDGQLCETEAGYKSSDLAEEVQGTLGFLQESVILVRGNQKPIYLLNVQGWLCEGDQLRVRITRTTADRQFGVVIEYITLEPLQALGRMITGEGAGYVLSYDRQVSGEIQLLRGSKRAKDGEIVLVSLDRHKSLQEQAWCGDIVQILGDRAQGGIEIDMAIAAHRIPHEWPAAVLKACEKWSEIVPKGAYKDREDLRTLPLVTIDGEDAKDFDDAVYCETRDNGGWRLIVAIADVAHYVKPRSALDKEAEYRGNSVYFPGSVIPMLPEILSNGLCSLKADVDRLCMACDMTISPEGKVTHYRFFNAIMHSQARLTYNEVAAILEGNKRLRLRYGPLVGMLQQLHALYQALDKSREKRGAIAFETVETQFLFNEQGKIEKIIPRIRNDAHKIIEECMLCANVSAARFLQKSKKPALYRVHEGPNRDKLSDLRKYLATHRLQLGGGDDPTPADYNKVMHQIQDMPDAKIIQTMLLRSLMQAVYSPRNEGHFGLAFPVYTHFTSPIRRYPDLTVHRAIKAILQEDTQDNPTETLASLEAMGEHCSLTERIADDATREATQALKCAYMANKVGHTYDGLISAVLPFGIFVELQGIYVDGLIHVTQLGADYFVCDSAQQRMVGERTGKIYRLGDAVEVRLVRVDLDSNKIDLQLVGIPVKEKQSPKDLSDKGRDRKRKKRR